MSTGSPLLYTPSISALAFRTEYEEAIARMLRHRARLAVCHDENDLGRQLAGRNADLLIIALTRADGTSAIPLLRNIRGRSPYIPIVGYVEASGAAPACLLAAGELGVNEVLVHRADHPGAAGDVVLLEAQRHVLVNAFRAELDALSSVHVRRFCAYGLAHATQRLTVGGVAANLHATRQHIAREFAARGLRHPGWYLGLARTLMAARLLEQPNHPIERVARAFGFPGARTLRLALRRYGGTGAGGGEAAQADFERLANRLRAALVERTPVPAARRSDRPPQERGK